MNVMCPARSFGDCVDTPAIPQSLNTPRPTCIRSSGSPFATVAVLYRGEGGEPFLELRSRRSSRSIPPPPVTQEQSTPTVQGVNFRSERAGEGDASLRLRQTGVCEEAAATFALLVAKAKSTGPQPAKAVDETHTSRRSLGDQATSSFVAPQASRIGSAPRGQNNRLRPSCPAWRSALGFPRTSLYILPGPCPATGRRRLHRPPRSPSAKLKVGAVDMIRWSMRPIASPTRPCACRPRGLR